MPSDCQHLRVRLKTEQYRLLDWAHVVRLDETDDYLLISNSSKGLLLDVLDQQRKLLFQYGRLDDKHKKLSKPLLVDAEEDNNGTLPQPPAYSILQQDEKTPNISRVDSDFQCRFPQSEALLKKSLAFASRSREFPTRLKWALFDKGKMENLVLKLAGFNDFMREMLNQSQLQSLAVKQARTEFQIMQLNSGLQNLVQIFQSAAITMKQDRERQGRHVTTNPIRTYMQARGFNDDENEEGEGGSDLAKPGLQNLASLAQIKALNSAIEDPTLFTDEFTRALKLPHTATEIRDSVELRREDIYILDDESIDDSDESHRVEAYYQPPRGRKTSVWIEWKTYDPPTFHHSHHSHASTVASFNPNNSTPDAVSPPDPILHSRVKALAALLHQNHTPSTPGSTNTFRAPHCIGYFRDISPVTHDDNFRYGLVFSKPPTTHPTTRPLSLHALVTTIPTRSVPVPSLTHRIALMRLLAETIERLHAVNWLHKGLRSANVLFFSDSGVEGVDWEDMYLSGFDYSRPAMSDDWTEKPPESAREDVYRHPSVQGGRNRDVVCHNHGPHNGTGGSTTSTNFKKSYDIYSLGILLLEIAYWKPVDEILGIRDLVNAKPSTTMKVRQRLLEEREHLEWVRSRLGDRVYDVVNACLRGEGEFGVREGEDERVGEVGARLQKAFYERVVKVLGDMRV